MRSYIVSGAFFMAICSIIYSCQSAGEIEMSSYMSSGKELYKTHCMNCHGATGEGLERLYPPLTDSLFLKKYKSRLACTIKNGSKDTVVVNGKTYSGEMPAFKSLAPIDIAQLMVYVTNSFGSKQGMYTNEQVIEDLRKCRQ